MRRFLLIAAALAVLALLPWPAQARMLREDQFANRYTLTGEIQLTYERHWGSGSNGESGPSTNRFSHNTDLQLEGFIIDKRLISFTAETLFGQDFTSPGDTLTSYGFGLRFDLLNKKVKSGILRSLPQPIETRFFYYHTTNYQYFNYGLSLTYEPFERAPSYHQQVQQARQQAQQKKGQVGQGQSNDAEPPADDEAAPKKKPASQAQQGQQGQLAKKAMAEKYTGIFGVPFPIFWLDFDGTDNQFKGQSSRTTQTLDLRAETRGVNAEYLGEYRLYRYGGERSTSEQTLEVQGNYFYAGADERKPWRLDVRNRIYATDIDGKKTLSATNSSIWRADLGPDLRDSLQLGALLAYNHTEDLTNYSLTLDGSYAKYFSERFRTNTHALFNIGREGDKTRHNETIDNSLTYRLSRIFSVSNRIAVGANENGGEASFSAGLTAATKIIATTMYTLDLTNPDEGRTTRHRGDLLLSGILFRTFRFTSQNYYEMRDVEGIQPYKEKTLSLRGDLYWVMSRFNINLGATSIQTKRTENDSVTTGTNSIYANISTYIMNRMYLNMLANYSKEKTGLSTLTLNPIVTWYIRMVTLSAEYQYFRRTQSGESSNEHRILLRLSRRIQSNIRPFF